MTEWLIRIFVKNPAKTTDRGVRGAYGTLGTCTGVAINIILSAAKFFIGLLSGSLAIMADAVNNLSDAAGSVMALISVRLAGKPDDKKHPFGHGRMEYIGALAVGILILVAGVQLLREGFSAIQNPTGLSINLLVLLILAGSCLVKFWLFFFYRSIARKIDSEALYAASKDSISDVAATATVLLSMVLQKLFGWKIDG